MLAKLEAIQKEFNAAQTGGKKVSLADLIVLGGGAAVEKAAKDAGHDVKVPFTPGRMDASQEQTDVDSFARARADRRRLPQLSPRQAAPMPAEELLVDRAQLLTLTAPEMTVLVGGLRVLGANAGQVQARRLHQAAGDADQRLLRQPARHEHAMAAGRSAPKACSKAATARPSEVKWTGTRVDLIFGSHSQLRALAEVYASARLRRRSSSRTSSRPGPR